MEWPKPRPGAVPLRHAPIREAIVLVEVKPFCYFPRPGKRCGQDLGEGVSLQGRIFVDVNDKGKTFIARLRRIISI